MKEETRNDVGFILHPFDFILLFRGGIVIRHILICVVIGALVGLVSAQDFSAWKHHRPIRLNTSGSGSDVKGDVANFPVAIALNGETFDFAQARPDGSDVRFSGEHHGVPLVSSIEHWDAAGKSALVWVKIPLVKGNSDSQRLVMHWGNPSATGASDSAQVP
jgi:hypothetical protein